jgi:Protein of unknown function (DUF4019)
MRAAIAAILLASLGPIALADAAPHEINITSDSAPHWLPSTDQEHSARKTVDDFLAALDTGRPADAYALMTDANKSELPFPAFENDQAKFNALAGAVRERRVVKIAWTKDPANASGPGVYAAVDLVSRFAEIDRHCGYLILYQAPDGGTFKVMRQESNYFPNAEARRVERQKSRAAVDALWSELSAHCPNYPSTELRALSTPLPEADRPTIGYDSVGEALAALKARQGVTFTVQNGWTVVTDPAEAAVWSFPPKGHPAYPSAVKRQIENRSNGAYVNMSVQCEASKSACDDLVRSFETLNQQMSNYAKDR